MQRIPTCAPTAPTGYSGHDGCRFPAVWRDGPSFLPRGLKHGQALEVARNIDPFQRALDLASSPKDKRNFRRIADVPKVVKANRHRVIRELAALAAKLKPLQVKLQGKLNPLAPARIHHIPLITFLVRKLGYPDKTSPSDLTKGMKITGTIGPSHVLSHRKSPATKQCTSIRIAGKKHSYSSISKGRQEPFTTN